MTHKNPCIKSQLKLIKINLQHSKLASASLAQLLLDKQIDAAIIQEPYVSVQRIEKTILLPDVPPGYSSFHNITSDYMFGTAIIAKSYLNGTLISSLSQNSTTAITISTPPPPRPFPSILYVRSPISHLAVQRIFSLIKPPKPLVKYYHRPRQQC
jgi:hypothetical protein